MDLFQALENGEGVVSAWLSNPKRIQVRQRARLAAHAVFLQKNGISNAVGLRWLGTPDQDESGLYRLKIDGNVALRVYFCPGPLDLHPDAEVTFLQGAFKHNYKLDPSTAGERALNARARILQPSDRARFCPNSL